MAAVPAAPAAVPAELMQRVRDMISSRKWYKITPIGHTRGIVVAKLGSLVNAHLPTVSFEVGRPLGTSWTPVLFEQVRPSDSRKSSSVSDEQEK